MTKARRVTAQRGEPVTFTFQGQAVTAHKGETLATALLAAGVPAFGLTLDDVVPGVPIQTVSTETPQLMIPLNSLESLRRALKNGYIDYDYLETDRDLDTLREKWRASTLLHLFSDANDVADPALFLASAHARKITGQIMIVDGGALLKATGSG